MSAPVRPRRLVHQGHVEASGILIDAALCGEAIARQRVMTLWGRGCDVSRVDSRLLLLFSSPRLLDSHVSPGAPVVREGALFTTGPLTAAELQGLKASVRSRNMWKEEPRGFFLRRSRWTPSAWIDVTGFQPVAVEPLAAPPARRGAARSSVDHERAGKRGANDRGATIPKPAGRSAMLRLRDGSARPQKASLAERFEDAEPTQWWDPRADPCCAPRASCHAGDGAWPGVGPQRWWRWRFRPRFAVPTERTVGARATPGPDAELVRADDRAIPAGADLFHAPGPVPGTAAGYVRAGRLGKRFDTPFRSGAMGGPDSLAPALGLPAARQNLRDHRRPACHERLSLGGRHRGRPPSTLPAGRGSARSEGTDRGGRVCPRRAAEVL